MQEQSYILTSWVNALLLGLKNDGCNISEILSHAKIHPDVLDRGYCSLHVLTKVFDSAQVLYGDYLGVSSKKGVTPSSFRSLSISILTSKNLYEGFYLLAKHNEIITNVLDFVVDDDRGGRFGFRIEDGYEMSLPLVSAVLGRAMRTASFIQPSSSLVTLATFAYAEPENAKDYEAYFSAEVEWEADVNAIYIEKDIFFSESVHADAELCENAEKTWLTEVSTCRELDFIQRVEAHIKSHIGGNRLTVELMAEQFGVSVRTFQRRLNDADVSFSDLIMNVRKAESKSLLSNKQLSVTDTAYSLGFSDAGSFSRAFRRWFGMSPDQYRKTVC